MRVYLTNGLPIVYDGFLQHTKMETMGRLRII
jgi:hypothetical protein